MKSIKILCAATAVASMFFSACGDSDSSDDFYCDVRESSTKVTVSAGNKGNTYTEEVTTDGKKLNIVSEVYYTDARIAREECEDAQEEASSWKDGSVTVVCSGNTIKKTDFSESTSLAEYALGLRYLCDEMKSDYESGELDEE